MIYISVTHLLQHTCKGDGRSSGVEWP